MQWGQLQQTQPWYEAPVAQMHKWLLGRLEEQQLQNAEARQQRQQQQLLQQQKVLEGVAHVTLLQLLRAVQQVQLWLTQVEAFKMRQLQQCMQ